MTSMVTSSQNVTGVPVTTSDPCHNKSGGGGFDTGSFIGGILLGVGIMVIAYVAYRLYASRQTDTPYHQF